MQVLIVEDAPDYAQLLEMLVQRCGHRAHAVSNGQDALDFAQRVHPSLVLVDLGLPGMDGYEVASRLRSEGMLGETKIMAISGYAPDQRRNEQAGINGHLMKPVRLSALKALLEDSAAADAM